MSVASGSRFLPEIFRRYIFTTHVAQQEIVGVAGGIKV